MLTDLAYPKEVRHAMIEGDAKEEIIPELGVTTRKLMQTIGTEWGRDIINKDTWVNIGVAKMKHARNHGIGFTCDDARFTNEISAITDNFNAVVVRIISNIEESNDTHESENLPEWLPDVIVLNTFGEDFDVDIDKLSYFLDNQGDRGVVLVDGYDVKAVDVADIKRTANDLDYDYIKELMKG